MGAGAPPHPANHTGPAGTGGAPGDPERRLCRQGDRETQLHYQVYRGHKEGETDGQQVLINAAFSTQRI